MLDGNIIDVAVRLGIFFGTFLAVYDRLLSSRCFRRKKTKTDGNKVDDTRGYGNVPDEPWADNCYIVDIGGHEPHERRVYRPTAARVEIVQGEYGGRVESYCYVVRL